MVVRGREKIVHGGEGREHVYGGCGNKRNVYQEINVLIMCRRGRWRVGGPPAQGAVTSIFIVSRGPVNPRPTGSIFFFFLGG